MRQSRALLVGWYWRVGVLLSVPLKSTSLFAVQSPESFTSFMYWRDPLPEIDIATELSPTDESGDEVATVIEDCLQNRQQAGDGSAASSDQNSAGSGDSKQGQSVTKLEDIQLADAANTDELDHFLSDFKLGKVCALDLCVSL